MFHMLISCPVKNEIRQFWREILKAFIEISTCISPASPAPPLNQVRLKYINFVLSDLINSSLFASVLYYSVLSCNIILCLVGSSSSLGWAYISPSVPTLALSLCQKHHIWLWAHRILQKALSRNQAGFYPLPLSPKERTDREMHFIKHCLESVQ